jgi:hypothetical protein
MINRVRNGSDVLRLLRRHDHAKRLHSPARPVLFQRRHGLVSAMITTSRSGTLIHRIAGASGLCYADAAPIQVTPQDFRRTLAARGDAAAHLAIEDAGDRLR